METRGRQKSRYELDKRIFHQLSPRRTEINVSRTTVVCFGSTMFKDPDPERKLSDPDPTIGSDTVIQM
jgi:hypothetical protein